MSTLFVVDREKDWPHDIANAAVATAHAYLTGEGYTTGQYERVINLCRCDRHQGSGFYVSLLAEARGHRPLPDVKTIEDLHGGAGAIAAELEALIEASVPHGGERSFELNVFFGHDPERAQEPLAEQLFARVRAPLLRAEFREVAGRWRLKSIRALAAVDVAKSQGESAMQAASEFVNGGRRSAPQRVSQRPAIAILHNADAPQRPSNPLAMQKFLHAAEALGMRAEIIDQHAIERLEGFDALFIRDTTWPNHYTYQFSRRAAALGLVVIDDPDSILQCNNKVYLNELVRRHQIPVPKTLLVHRDNVDEIVPTLGLPCIIKQPDSAFSLGVAKIESEAEIHERVKPLFEKSELFVAQEYVPTEFDWRVGILDRRPIYVCQYFMAPGHWQVIKHETARHIEGRTVAITVGEAPEVVVRNALRVANLIGDGFYGVDLKQVGERCYVMEINDNPNVDAGNEDGVLKDALYREIMGVFLRRIVERRRLAAA